MSGLTLPGEVVELRETGKKSGYLEGKLLRIITPSPARIRPRCPVYGECGGCDLQHADYAEQLRIKKEIVEESLQRAGVPFSGAEDTVPSPAQWGYRYRLRLKISPAGQLSFFRKKSNKLVPIERCPAAAERINSALARLNETGALQPLAGICPEIELLQSPADGKITLVLRPAKQKKPPAAALRAVAGSLCIDQIVDQIGWISRQGFRYIAPERQQQPLHQQISLDKFVGFTGKSCSLFWSGGCFSQVNPGQNEQLIRLVCNLAGDLQGKTVLDLYCGMGNFSVPLGLCGGTVTGIESSRESVLQAEQNAELAGIRAGFFAADVSSSLHQLAEEGQQADLILLDPPRTGIGKAAALLPALQPEKIIYVSCNPATLARDLRTLQTAGYNVARLIPVDMFPQTAHIETVALLQDTRSSSV